MDRASICIPRVLKHEGGFVNHPRDPGGATNRGITLATFRRYIKRGGTVADLKSMTDAQAVAVYKAEYWDAVQADLLPVGVDYAVADFAVNSGPSRAAKYLQAVVGVAQDGRIGPVTLAAVGRLNAVRVIEKLCRDRMNFLRRLKTWPDFGRGWTRRVTDVRTDAIADAKHPHPPDYSIPPAPVDHVAPDPAERPRPWWVVLLGWLGK